MARAPGGTVASAHTISQMLSKLAADNREDFEQAAEAHDWSTALNKLSTSFVWRAVSLAVGLELCPFRLPWQADAADIGVVVGAHVLSTLRGLEASDDPASRFQKGRFVLDVLEDVLSIRAGFSKLTADVRDQLFLVTISAIELGQHGAMLELAETGHWDEVAHLKNRRVGRPKGYTSAWSVELQPAIQGWIDSHPRGTRTQLIEATFDLLRDWVPADEDKRATPRKKPRPEDASAVSKTLKKMVERGDLRLPPDFGWKLT